MPSEVAAMTVQQISFLVFTVVSMLDLFISKWWVGNHSCRPQSAAPVKQFNSFFSCHDFSLLLLEALPAALVAPRVGPMVFFQVDGIALNMMRDTQEQREIT